MDGNDSFSYGGKIIVFLFFIKIQFRLKEFEVTRLGENGGKKEKGFKNYRTSILRAELIDRAAVFTVTSTGFYVHICIKGNLHEYERKTFTGKICSFLFSTK